MEPNTSSPVALVDFEAAVPVAVPNQNPPIAWNSVDWGVVAQKRLWGEAPDEAMKAFLEKVTATPGEGVSKLYTPPKDCLHCGGTGIYGFKWAKKSTTVCTEQSCKICPKCLEPTLRRDNSEDFRKRCTKCDFFWVAHLGKTQPWMVNPRTQKVKGLKALTAQDVLATSKFLVLGNPEEVDAFEPNGMFIRPCPTKPRHGFVESRVCEDRSALQAVWKQAREADPEAELIAMDMIAARASGIFIPESGALALGPGHDGATGGKKSILLPVMPVLPVKTDFAVFALDKIRKDAEIDDDAHTYIELVYKKSSRAPSTSAIAVQARSGPPLVLGKPDYIPAETKVLEVITPGEDLLAWEKLVIEKKGQPGVVAYQKNATLACHAAVHCVAAGIPFVTTKKPKKNSILKANVEKVEFDPVEFEKGISIGWASGVSTLKIAVTIAVAILHNSTALSQSKHWPRLYGYMAAVLFKAGALACIGESRHKTLVSGVQKTSRTGAWRAYAGYSPRWIAQKLGRLVPAFLDGCWEPSYGGPNWAHCCIEVARLYKAMAAGDQAATLMAANNVVNTSHNNGKLLTKFTGTLNVFDIGATMPSVLLSQCGAHIYKILTRANVKKPIKLKAYLPRSPHFKMSEPFIYNNSEKLRFVTIKIPNTNKGGITATTRPMKWDDENDPVFSSLVAWKKEL